MVEHKNNSITQWAQRKLRTKVGQNLTDDVSALVATLEIGPVLTEIYSTNPSTSASTNTAFTLPTEKDFYLVSASYAIVKDATCDSADGQAFCRATVNGAVKTLFGFPLLTLTAQQYNETVFFDPPLKIDRGGVLQITAPTFTVGKFSRVGTYIGYYEETTAT